MVKQPFILEIPKRSKVCSHGQEPFLPGSDYYSTLLEDAEGYVRRDFCTSCWETQVNNLPLQQARSVWKSQVPVKAPGAKEDMTRDQRALAALKDAIAANTPELDLEAFVLALYLGRKKQLAFRDELDKEGQLHFLYEELMTEEIFCVKKVDLAKIDVDKVQQKLANKLAQR